MKTPKIFDKQLEELKTKLKEIKSFKDIFKKPEEVAGLDKRYLFISTFFGCGYFTLCPGTFTSFIAIIIGIILTYISSFTLMIVLIILLVLGFISSDKASTRSNPDPSFVVIDEVVGQLIPFLLIENQLFHSSIFFNTFFAIFVFIVFRLLDIYKPWLIGKAERHYKGGIAIMMDDIIAGIFTLFIAFIVLMFI